ncbi:hypothetical protein DFJ67_3979 [Asanoa ferruginea]|uniref:PknH-like protein n=1 Tax=Asanoa ferruginea TaxID=53367 RepID=A0A3D9ZWB4_9ACTN|nr:hypothetical protein [Asanoa ferruginea]REF97970.1 hypothetical protein DFJ67_3979 [Asanoa ferruginea]GIF50004.1 hypothetical protein Afe04nite_45430 [Asanoa ferruginea]
MADLDELAGRLDHELPDVAWAEPDRIRARGRGRRRQRSVFLAALSVLVIAAGAGWFAAVHPSTPEPRPAASGPTDAAPLPMLRPEDVGSGYRVTNYQEFPAGTYPAWSFGSEDCPAYADMRITAYATHLWYGQENLTQDGGATVTAEAGRYPAGQAAQLMADVQHVVTNCAHWETGLGEAATTTKTYTMLDRDFAGDEAALVRLTVDIIDKTGNTTFSARVVLAAVRVGDAVTVVQVERDDPDLVRLLGQRAADRLCTVERGC